VIYYVLSLIVSYVTSRVSDWLNLRAEDLKVGLEDLISDPSTLDDFLKHPLIANLRPKRVKPLWPFNKEIVIGDLEEIPTQTFSLALVDLLLSSSPQKEGDPLDRIKAAVEGELPSGQPGNRMGKELLALIDASENKIENARKLLETRFDDTMSRISALYKQHARRIAFVVALVVTFALGVDSIAITKYLWHEPSARAAVVAEAESIIAKEGLEEGPEKLVARLEALDIPAFWWSAPPESPWGWFQKVIGVCLSWIAVGQGSSFWYRILKQLTPTKSASTPTGSVTG
jgi:hypothetical protein